MPWQFLMSVGPMCFADLVVDTALQLNNRALRTLADRRGLLSEEEVHRLRVSVKRLRALWQLVRRAAPEAEYTEARPRLKTIHAALAAARDVSVIVETLERLAIKAESDRVRDAVLEFAAAFGGDLPPTVLAIPIGRVSECFQEESRAWREIELNAEHDDLLIAGYVHGYRSGRRLGKRALHDGDWRALHRWRRWVKFSLHQLDVINPGLGEVNRARRWYLDRLGDTLGVHNDCAMLLERLDDFRIRRRERDCISHELETRIDSTRARAAKLYPYAYGDSRRAFEAEVRADIARLALDQTYLLPRSA